MVLHFSGVDLRKVSDGSFHSKLIGSNLKLSVKTAGSVSLSFFNEAQLAYEISVNSSAECHRSFEKSALIYVGGCNPSYVISFINVDDLMQFLSEMNKRSNTSEKKGENSCHSTFDEKTDSWSAVQYFQFYSYLSQQQNMMQDYVRTSTYQRAILANASVDFAGKVVLDVGAGSGILSFFAIQAGAKRVYAVEASNMAAHCKVLVQSNNLSGRIVVVSGKIEEITLPEPVDVIISEPMGYMLYNERMLETYVHARKFLAPKHQRLSSRTKDAVMMEEGKTAEAADEDTVDETEVTAFPKSGVMFPSVANLYVVPFSDEALFAEQYTKANFWYQQSFHGMDLSSLRTAAITEYFNQPVVDTFDIGLCPAVPCVHRVDFRTCKESDLTTIEIPLRFEIYQCSTIHGLAFWFDVGFLGSQKDVWLSTSPTEPLTHWYQVRCLLGTALFVQEGQILTGHVSMRANTRQSYDVDMELVIPGSDTIIRNRLDLKNPHFRYNGYPPAPAPGSQSQPPTETYYANAAAAASANAAATNETHVLVNGTANPNPASIQQQQIQASPTVLFTGAQVLTDVATTVPVSMLPTGPTGDIFINGWVAGGAAQQLVTTPVVPPGHHFQLPCNSNNSASIPGLNKANYGVYEKSTNLKQQPDIMRNTCVQKNS